jgi:hypothetical protein
VLPKLFETELTVEPDSAELAVAVEEEKAGPIASRRAARSWGATTWQAWRNDCRSVPAWVRASACLNASRDYSLEHVLSVDPLTHLPL